MLTICSGERKEMNKKSFLMFCLFLLFSIVTVETSAQERQNTSEFIDFLSNLTGVPTDSLNKEFSRLYSDILENTETINKVLDTYIVERSGISFLRDVNLKFKTFRTNGQDNNAALGLSYSYSKDVKKDLYSQTSSSSSGLSFAVKADGNLSFDRQLNPEDFLDSRLSFHFFHSHGGVVNRADTSVANRLNDLEDELTMITDPDSLIMSPVWSEFMSTVSGHLTTQFYLDLSLRAGLESDQDFRQKQYVYGIHLGLDLKAWNKESYLANLNIFDWPFAVLRVFTGYDRELSPRGSTIPTILAGIDQVDPKNDILRFSAGDESSYPRLSGEISFKTPVSRSADFGANFRYYRELNASPAVKNANLDEYRYFTLALTLSNGMYVSYATGKLPFDDKDDEVYELGFRYRFD
jgi:hypothetical protein